MGGDIVQDILSLLRDRGSLAYGESVTQLQHALQCASLAERDGASAALVGAALLHDLGHLLHQEAVVALTRGQDDRHEALGAQYLKRHFPEDVTRPIELHVQAKRYLCLVEPGYGTRLSVVSRRTLALQGGAMSEDEAERFVLEPFALDAVRVRRWDEGAKVADAVTPPLAHFRETLTQCRRTR